MKFGIRRLLTSSWLILAFITLTASAQQALRLDVDYRLIPQQPIGTGNKIEVIDFFWYGCPHCNKFQPAFEQWRKRMPADVEVRRIPAVRHDNWGPHARIFYALQALGELERLHQAVYHSYHVEELYMSKPEVMEAWAVEHGIDREKWLAAYNSPEVLAQVEQAKVLTAQYDIQGTPSLVVDGRYLTSGSLVKETRDMIPILDQLIRLARAQRQQAAH
jgi:thiol:disulfide interchange protein DsbA